MDNSVAVFITRRSHTEVRMLAPPKALLNTMASKRKPSKRASCTSRNTRRSDAIPAVPSVTRMPLLSINHTRCKPCSRAWRTAVCN